MSEFLKLIEKLQRENKITSNNLDDFDAFLFEYKALVYKLEKNKLKKSDRELITSLLHLLYDLNLYV